MICKIYNLALFIMKRQFPAGDFASPVLTKWFTKVKEEEEARSLSARTCPTRNLYIFLFNQNIFLYIPVCPRSSYPFYIVTYYIKWVTTSWIDGKSRYIL